MKQRILFISEAVTLAHVARPLALAQSLDPSRYEVHFASAYWSETLFNNTSLTYWPIESISYEAFIQSVGGGDSAYTDALLEMYLWEEDSLYRDIRPDLVVSDARLSTCVSAPAAGIPLVNINNAYWSPYRKDPLNPVPEYTRSTLYNRFPPRLAPILFPYPVVKFIFPFLQRIYQNRYLAPFNRALKQRGLPAFSDFESFYTFGNWTLYCETPELIPLEGAPSHHRYIGPLLWSPPRSSPLPKIDHTVPTIYVSFGSSNEVPHCREIIQCLSTMNLRLLVATAGRFDFPSSERVHVADSLPGSEACRQADLVVCSGGSTAAYQALFEGTPVLGIPSNADQHLAMGSIERNGAGLSIRSDHATPQNVSEAVNRLLSTPSFKIQARRFSKNFQSYDARQRFQDFVKEILPLASPEPARPGSPQVLPERLRRVAEEAPDKPAFWGLVERQRGQSPLTYGQVWARVQSLALGLLEIGLQKGERVGFLAGVTPEWELLHQAVLLAGGVVVGLDLHEAPERVLGAARESDIRGWVVQNDQVIKEWPALWRAPPLDSLYALTHPIPLRSRPQPFLFGSC